MAKGYLGKISAIVSANTADFDGKLSRSAKEVSLFARNVQSNLTSASRQAAKSLEGIYTPLQRFERSLQAAATMKLSFKGFPGMIKDLDGLQQRLNSVLSQRQVDIVLKTTGMSSVSALRDAISGLKSKDIELIARVGGIDKLKELGGKIETDVEIDAARKNLADLTAAAEAAKAKVKAIGSGAVTVKVDAESVDSLRAKLEATQAAASKFMGGEYLGQKSLNKAISGVSGELVNVEAELARAVAAQKTLETMASGPRSKPEELSRANDRVSSLTGQKDVLAKNLAELEKHRDDVRQVMREIKQAEAGGGAAASGGDIAAARKEEAAAVRAVSLATKDLQKQLSARFGVDIDITSLTALIEKANTAGGVINNLGELIENLGKSDFDAAADSMRKLQSASSQIFEPLAASVKKLAGLAVEFQAPFHDALKGTQADVERLKVAIDAVGDDGASPELLAFFDEVQAKSNGATKAIDRLAEVSGRLDQLKTGREFVFEQPGMNEAINRGGDIGNRAAALPAETLRTNPAIAQSLVDIRRLSDEAGVAYAKFLAVKDQKQPTGEAQKELDSVVGKLLEAQAASDRLIASGKLRADEAAREATEIGVSLASLQAAGAVAGQYAAARRVVADEAAREATEIGVSLASLQSAGAVAGQYAAARRVVADEAAREATEIGVSLASLQAAGAVAGQYAAARRVVADEAAREATEIGVSLAALQSAGAVAGQYAAARRVVADEAAREATEIGVSLASLQSAGAVAGQYAAARRVVADEAAREATEIGVSLASLQAAGAVAGQYAAARRVVADEAAREAVEIGVSLASLQAAGAVAGQYAAARRVVADEAAREAVEIGVSLDALKKSASIIPRRSDLYDNRRADVRLSVTGSFANADQIEAEVSRVTADIQKLEATQKAAFGQRAMLVIDLLGENKIQDAAIEVKNLRSDLDQQMELKVTTDAAQKAVDDFKAKMDRVREQNAFTITDRPQNMEQAESRESSLRGEIGGLRGSQRAKFTGLLEDAAVARETGDLDKYNDALDRITVKLASAKRFNVRTAEAKKSLDDLNNDLRSLADALGPPVGMSRLKESTQAADAAVQKLGASLDKTRLEADIGQLRVDIGAAERLPAGAAKDQAIDSISARAEGITQDAGRVAGSDDAVEKARARIGSLNDAWAQAIRGLPQTEEKADAFFTGLMADVGKLDLADRISLDPIISDVMNLIQTGAGISTVTARMMELEAATNELASAGKVSAAIEKLSPTAARNDLEARLAAAKAAATSPIPLATPGESVEDVGRETELRGSLGKDLADSSRQLDVLKGGITSLKSQIDALPEGVRSRFIPAIRDAENEFVRLSTSSATLPGQIDAARQRVQQLAADAARATQAMNFSQSFGGAGVAGLNLGLDQRSLMGYNAQMQVIQGAIGRASAEARGPAVAAFERLRAAVATAFDEGRLDSAATREELARLRQQAVAAAAAVGGIRVGTLTRDVQRAGDVGRQGFDRFSLALNQAAFAIDDFMSSTGGLEFKLRAVSNNITQLAFVLGGTTGLFIGLGAVIAGQAAIGLIKFMNSGRSAEDQTKALNDALAKQKSLVDGLAESHKALADAILRGTASGSSESERKIVSGQADLRRQSAELSAERKAAADTAPLAPQSISRMIGEFFEPRQRRNEFQGVAELRAELNKLQKQLEAATTVGERSTIQGRIRDTGRAELAARGRLAAEQTPDASVVQSAIRGSATSSEMASSGTFLGVNSQRMFSNVVTGSLSSLLGVNRARYDQQAAANEGLRGVAAQVPASVQGQIEALRRAQELKRPEQGQADYGFIRTGAALDADREIAKFEALIQSLQKVMESGIVDSAAKTYAASVDAANSIRAAQEDVADAIKRGVPAALAFQAELDKLASELASADDELRTAVTANPDDQSVTPEARESAIKRAQERVDGVNRQRAEVESRAREVRLGRTFGGERTTKALSSLEGNERFANEQAGMIASLKRAVDDEVQARRKASEAAAREAAIVDLIAKKRTEVANSGGDINKRQIAEADIKAAEADLEKAKAAREAASAASGLAQAASEVNAAFAEAAIAIESTLARIRKVGDSALQRSEQGADAAQKAFEENPILGGGREARDAAEYRLINDRARVGYAQAELSNRRSQIQSDPRMVGINSELETITQRRKDLEAKSATRGGLNFAERDELGTAAKREIELIRQRDSVARELTAGEQEQLDVINSRIAAREKELEVSRRRSEESQEFSRIRSQAEGTLGEASRRADEAQQRFVNNPTDENKQRRDEAEDNLRKRQSKLQQFQDKADLEKKQIEASPEFQQNNKELQQIAERRAKIAENSAGRAMTPAEVNELTGQGGLLDREKELRGKNEGLMQQGLEPFRNGIDEAQRRDALLARADRGRDLGMTDRERFRKEFTEGAGADINARAKEMRDKGEDPSKFLRQAVQNQMESVAPMLKGFQDERRTAALQGPSRAALNVSDVSTSQGASELTRLIRGDDSAKDVNLAELQKQSGFLEEIKNDLKANNPGVLL